MIHHCFELPPPASSSPCGGLWCCHKNITTRVTSVGIPDPSADRTLLIYCCRKEKSSRAFHDSRRRVDVPAGPQEAIHVRVQVSRIAGVHRGDLCVCPPPIFHLHKWHHRGTIGSGGKVVVSVFASFRPVLFDQPLLRDMLNGKNIWSTSADQAVFMMMHPFIRHADNRRKYAAVWLLFRTRWEKGLCSHRHRR